MKQFTILAFVKTFETVTSEVNGLKLLSVDDSMNLLPQNTSAGFPFKQGTRKGWVRDEIVGLAKEQWKRVAKGDKILVAPCGSGARKQLRLRGKNKPRLIWVYPAHIGCIENQFGASFNDVSPSFMGWSINWLDKGYSLEMLQMLQRHFRASISVDYSTFDASLPAFLIKDAFKIFECCFTLTPTERNMLKQLREYFIHTPIVLYDDVFVKHRGIPSGSSLTQIIGSICNLLLLNYCTSYSGFTEIKKCYVLGDDSLLFLSEVRAKDEMDDVFERSIHFGVTTNCDKMKYNFVYTDLDDSVVSFLSRDVFVHSKKISVDLDKLRAQILYPEHPDKCPDDLRARLIGLAWAFGFDRKAYAILRSEFSRLGNKNPKTLTRDVMRFLKYSLGIEEVEMYFYSFPEFDLLENRYFGYPYGFPRSR
jgi:hypothetical protein